MLLTLPFKPEYNFPEPPDKLSMMSIIILLIALTALFLMSKSQLAKYRSRLLAMSLDEIKRTCRNAGIYVAATLITFFTTAFLIIDNMSNQ